jgi:hypothetical protein
VKRTGAALLSAGSGKSIIDNPPIGSHGRTSESLEENVMHDFYRQKWEGEELDRELLVQMTLAIETLRKIVWLSGLSVAPSKLGDAMGYLVGRKQRLERKLGIAPQSPADSSTENAEAINAP